ncbi:MAG TPA: hypothetical protein VIH99_07720 [Bdellovibrionota bacterium]|jgi:hypothetical protein
MRAPRLSLVFATLLLSACGGTDKTTSVNSQSVVRDSLAVEAYQYVIGGCDTGKHEFSAATPEGALEQLCIALQKDKLNNSCAEARRQQAFEAKCSGTWTPDYSKYDDTHKLNDPEQDQPANG